MKNQFIEIPASKRSIAKRKLLFGVGINDADYMTQPIVNDKQIRCPFYARWKTMLQRCYYDKFHARNPTYTECKVTDEWLRFSTFKNWMMKQDWEGKQIDKDILNQGNRLYSPDNCLFVYKAINLLLNPRDAARGDYPRGVSLNRGRYMAKSNIDGKEKYIGMFGTAELAHEAYKSFKYKLIAEIAARQSEPLRSALLRYEIK